jgi:LacI family transcriptional regulator
MTQPPSLDDVARVCGLSKATVSKVFSPRSGAYAVNADTRQRIVAAAAALGYVPDKQRQRAARKRTRTIALLFQGRAPAPQGTYISFLNVLAGALADRGYGLTFAALGDSVAAWQSHLHHHAYDAGILVPPLPADPELLPGLGIPVVVFNELLDVPLTQVLSDEAQGCAAVVAHLWDLGHRRIAWWIDGTGHTHYSARERQAFCTQEVTARGGTIIDLGSLTREAVLDRCHAEGLTAVVAYCHVEGLALLQAAHARGLAIPERLSVAAFDDNHLVRLACPALTTVETGTYRMAETAARLAVELAEERWDLPPQQVRIVQELLVRASTSAPWV